MLRKGKDVPPDVYPAGHRREGKQKSSKTAQCQPFTTEELQENAKAYNILSQCFQKMFEWIAAAVGISFNWYEAYFDLILLGQAFSSSGIRDPGPICKSSTCRCFLPSLPFYQLCGKLQRHHHRSSRLERHDILRGCGAFGGPLLWWGLMLRRAWRMSATPKRRCRHVSFWEIDPFQHAL